jgi:predicted ATPase
LGGRALDILIVLVEHAGEVVSKRELIAKVWPDVTVNDGSLRFHVAALRKALGDGEAGARYVANVPGRGYCFVAPISRPAAPQSDAALTGGGGQTLPARAVRMIGRDETVDRILTELRAWRLVNLVGPGGVGKTTVAVAVAHRLLAAFDGAIYFVDLGPLIDPALVPSALAAAVGLSVYSSDPLSSLVTFLRDRSLLIVLDSCEHVIETAAVAAERIFKEAPRAHILATSREALRVEGEHVHRLPPLGCPPDDPDLRARDALAFPAAQLFVERVAASGADVDLSDADARVVGEICRKLDGVALAIELAAGRVDAYGIHGTAALLGKRLGLRWQGRRTAAPRHQTLTALLDWSYDLLSELERTVLRRVAIFVGRFTLEAARTVAAGDDLDGAEIVDACASLVAKSLISVNARTDATSYRLLDTTRAYVIEKLVQSGEADAIARRHAVYYRQFLDTVDPEIPAWLEGEGQAAGPEHLDNLRAALEWSFSERGDIDVGTALAAASAPLLLEMSLLTECHYWAERAISALVDAGKGSRREMELQAALGVSLMFTRGNGDAVRAAFARGLELAGALGEPLQQLRLLGGLHIFHERIGDFHNALAFAERGMSIAEAIADPAAIGAAHSLLGISYHLIGNAVGARAHLDAALARPQVSRRINTILFGFDHRNRARIAEARNLWLLGFPDQAARAARATVDDAARTNHPVTLAIALIWAVSVYLWRGDLASAEESIERFIAHAERHSLAPYTAVGLGVKGELSVRRGDADAGIQALRDALETLHAARYELLTTASTSALAEGLALRGDFAEALSTIEEGIARIEANGDLFAMPELLRIKGDILAASPQPDLSGAADCFRRSLDWARRQSAASWELRTAISLARLRLREGQGEDARETLAPVYARFTEGFESGDLVAARALLGRLPPS